nr:DUF87 domain-containing protein [Clostridia bacterium]
MVRLMPGKIKVKKTIVYKFTLKDLIFALILAILAIVILTKINVIAGIVYLIFSILLFIPIKDNFAYEEIFNILKFVFSKKKIKIKNISNIKSVTENKIEFSDGSFAKAIVIGQKSFLFETEQNQNEDIDIFEEALKCIDSNVNFKICKIEKPIEINKQISTLKERIDTEKDRIRKSILAKEYIELVNTQKNTFETKNEFFLVIYSKSIDELDRYISRIGQSLREANLDSHIASDVELNELISFSYLCNTTTTLNEVLEKDIHIKSSNINLGEYKSATISISNMPKSVVNAWGRKICNIKNTFVCINVKQISTDTAINQIDNSISEMGIKQSLATKASDVNMANLHIDSLNSLLTNIQNGTELVYNVEIHITSFNKSESELRQHIKNICKLEGMQINNNIFSQGLILKNSRIENNSDNSKFAFGINSKTLAAIFPFVEPEINDENGVYIGKDIDNQHVFLDIFKRSDIYQNSNGYVIGTPGSGKSFFLKKLVLLSFSSNTKIFILDPENEYTKLVNKLGGKVIDVGISYGCINPLQVFNIFTDSGINATNAQIFSSHLKTLENFYNLTLENTNEEIIELFNLLTIETYKEFNIDEHTQFNLLKNTDYPTFKDMLDC